MIVCGGKESNEGRSKHKPPSHAAPQGNVTSTCNVNQNFAEFLKLSKKAPLFWLRQGLKESQCPSVCLLTRRHGDKLSRGLNLHLSCSDLSQVTLSLLRSTDGA